MATIEARFETAKELKNGRGPDTRGELSAEIGRPKPLSEKAFPGEIGRLVSAICEKSGFDEPSLLASLLTYAGPYLGAKAFLSLHGNEQQPRLFTVLADDEYSWSRVAVKYAREVFAAAEMIAGPRNFPPPTIRQIATLTGNHFYDWVSDASTTNNSASASETETGCPRVLLEIQDFGPTWRQACRVNNELASQLAMSFEQTDLMAFLPKKGPVAITSSVSLLAHVIQDQIQDAMREDSRWHRLASTVLWVAGGASLNGRLRFDNTDLKDELICELALAIRSADKTSRVSLSPAAEVLWSHFCTELSLESRRSNKKGVACNEVQLLRLSTIYCLLGRSAVVEPVHVEAAMEFLRYTISSAQMLFLDHKSDDIIEKVQVALADGPKTQSQLHAIFSRKRAASALNSALNELLSSGLVTATRVCEGGRPKTIWKRIPVLMSNK